MKFSLLSLSRDAAVTMGQALVDTKRLQVVSSLYNQFKDEPNLFLGFGQAADMGVELVESPTDLDAPKWFQRLPENGDSEAEQSLHPDRCDLSLSLSLGYLSVTHTQTTLTLPSLPTNSPPPLLPTSHLHICSSGRTHMA